MRTILSAEGATPATTTWTRRADAMTGLMPVRRLPRDVLPPCFRIGDVLFPAVRHRAARRLAASGLTQVQIAARLGISQGMVSRYLRAEGPQVPGEMEWLVEALAEGVLVDEDLEEAEPTESTPAPGDVRNPWCAVLERWEGQGLDEETQQHRRALFDAVAAVLDGVRNVVPEPLVPAVNINIAGALVGAGGREDVLAYPGRLALVNGGLRAHAPPAFGASRHLASLLMQVQRERPDVRFCLNLRNDAAVREALDAAGEVCVDTDPGVRDDAGVPAWDADALPAKGVARESFTLLDPGAVGLEPVAYLVDASPERLVRRVRRLADRVAAHRL